MYQMNQIAPLFTGWNEPLIQSVLQGHMGYAIVDHAETPTSAQLVLGDFCFFGGAPSKQIVAKAAAEELVPQNEAWCSAIESVWGDRVVKRLRYSIKKEPDAFCRESLQFHVDSLPDEYELRLFDEALYAQSFSEKWSRDFCACFQDSSDFLHRGFGVAVLCNGEFVSGASSYTVYDGGVEIEIDTKPEFRQRGLATVCGARFILEALDRGLYPSWDAFDLRSVALAEKLGYHVDRPYVIYVMR